MGAVTSMLGSCAGACVAGCGCAALKSCYGGSAGRSKFPYYITLFLYCIVAAILRYYGDDVMVQIEAYVCPDGDKNSPECAKWYGIQAVYRLMAGLFVFFMGMSAVSTVQSCAKYEGGMWCVKAMILLPLTIMMFFLPSVVMDVYGTIAQVFAVLFIVMQLVFLIDFAYAWNENWINPPKEWKGGLICVSLFLYTVALSACVLLFVNFTVAGPQGHSCDLEKTMIAFTLILTFMFTVFSATELCEHGALLTSGVVTVYSYWILYSALRENPDKSCMSEVVLASGGEESPWVIIVGFLMAALSVVYAGWSMSRAISSSSSSGSSPKSERLHDDSFQQGVDADDVNVTVERNKIDDRDGVVNDSGEEEDGPSADYTLSKFFLVMAMCVCYACCLLSDWGLAASDSGRVEGGALMGIKLGTLFVCVLLYCWSLVAPLVLSNREF